MNRDLPTITVVTVVRNGAATLERAIQSLEAQAYPKLEYLLLDAASTDGTLDIIRRYGSLISHWRSHPDDGPSAAWNEGIAKASGEVVAFLNADDWYEPGILRTIGEAFAAHPHADLVTCEARIMEQRDGTWQERERLSGHRLEISPYATPMPNARFFRKSIFESYGNFLTQGPGGSRLIACDLEFMLRLSPHGLNNVILPVLGYNYGLHAGSATFSKNPRTERKLFAERAWIAEQYLARPEFALHRRRLKRWHRRGTTRGFVWALQERNWANARLEAQRGIRASGAGWGIDLVRLIASGGWRL